ncbi:MAG TPA: hypothetical protein VMF89_09030 [Polyangiales bacterium]|nr:hypothetical protein [Polyangiales bacterium]
MVRVEPSNLGGTLDRVLHCPIMVQLCAMIHLAMANRLRKLIQPDETQYQARLQHAQRRVRGAADSGIAAVIETTATFASGVAAVGFGPVVGALTGTAVRLAGDLLKNGVFTHYVDRGAAFHHETAREVGSRASNPAAMAESFRLAMASIDTVVYPALARLVAQYGTRPPDAFFKDFGQLLTALDSPAYSAMRELLQFLNAEVVGDESHEEYFAFDIEPTAAGHLTLSRGWASANSVESQSGEPLPTRHPELWQDAARRLLAAGLVSGPVSSTMTRPRHWVRPAVIKRLYSIVD